MSSIDVYGRTEPEKPAGTGPSAGCAVFFLIAMLFLLATALVVHSIPFVVLALVLLAVAVGLLVSVSRQAALAGRRGGQGPAPPPGEAPPGEPPHGPAAGFVPGSPLLDELFARLERLESEAAEIRALLVELRGGGVEATPPEESAVEALPPEPGPPEPATEQALAPEPAPAPSAPPYDWGKLWRSLAGPLAGGRSRGPEGAAETEARIGTVWFSRIGVLLLIAGGILGYRYGVTNNIVRVLIGYIAGLALLALGFWGQRRHYRVWALAITGGGIGVLYLTTIAATMLVRPAVIPDPVAFGLMVLVTAVATGLSVNYDSPVIGIFGVIGGFATAVPLATGPYDFRLLFTYVAVLDAGLLLVAYFRRWTLYNLLLLAATWGLYGLWRGEAARLPLGLAARAPWAFAFTTLFFLIFTAVTITTSLAGRTRRAAGSGAEANADDAAGSAEDARPGPTPVPDLILAVANAFAYFAAGLDLLRPAFSLTGGLFALGLAVFHLLGGLVVVRRSPGDRKLVLGLLGLAAVFLTVAFPVALNGPWITAAWAVEGAVLVWLGFWAGAREGRWAGLAALALAAGRLALWETFPTSFGGSMPGPLVRALTFLLPVAAFYMASVAYARHKTRPAVARGLAVAASAFSLWYLGLEVCLHYRQAWYGALASSAGPGPASPAPVALLAALTLAGVWALYGLVLSLADFRFRQAALRTGARLVLGAALVLLVAGGAVPVGHLASFDRLPAATRAAAGAVRCFGLAATLGSIWLAELVVRRRGLDATRNGALSLAASLVAFGAVTSEVLLRLAPYLTPGLGEPLTWEFARWAASLRAFCLVAAWGAYALLVTAVGGWLGSSSAKTAAGAYAAFAVIYAAAVAVPNLAAPPLLRGMAFLMLVPAVYLGGLVVARYRRTVPAPEVPPPRPAFEVWAWRVALLGATLLTAWWGAAEARAAFWDGRAFALVTWLGLYALAVGLAGRWLRAAEVRWLATGLQGVALLVLMLPIVLGLFYPDTLWAWKGAAFAALILGLYASNALFASPDRKETEASATRALALVACCLTVLWMSIEVRVATVIPGPAPEAVRRAVLSTRDHLTILIAGPYGLAVSGVGLWLRSRGTRVVGLGIQSLAAAAAIVAGTSNPAAPAALRVSAFVAALGGLYLVTWLVRRLPGRSSPAAARATEWLALAGAAATVAWLTAQVGQALAPFVTAGTSLEREFARSTLDFGISAVWAAYGLVVLVAGFVLRHRWTRVLGLGVLGLTLAKIGISDMWHLAVRWRIVITIGLGLVFVAASFLYQRFSRIILGEPGAKRKEAGPA